MRRRLTTLLICLFSFCAIGRAHDFRFFGADKLPNNQIHDICQDKRGFIWVATEYGLDRFDGVGFVSYTHDYKSPTSLGDNNVVCVTPSPDGSLWVGLINGMQRFCPRDDEFHNITFPVDAPRVTKIINLRSGNICMTTSGHGLFYMKNDKKYRALPWNDVTRKTGCLYLNLVYEDRTGLLWLGSQDKGTWTYDPRTRHGSHVCPNLLDGDITGINEDSYGNIYLTNHNNVVMYNHNAGSYTLISSLPIGQNITSSYLGYDGNLYLCTSSNGLLYINLGTHQVLHYPSTFGDFRLNEKAISRVLFDRSHNIWVGINYEGLIMIPSPLKDFNHWNLTDYTLKIKGYIGSLYCDRKGQLWAGTSANLFVKFDSQGNVLSMHNSPAYIRCLCQTTDGQLWAGMVFAGLSSFDERNGTFDHVAATGSERIQSICPDKNGGLYFSSFGHGFGYYNPRTKALKRFSSLDKGYGANHLTNDWINAVYVDREGLVWLGHCIGVNCYNPATGHYENVSAIKSQAFLVCYAITQDSQGRIWLGTDNGIIIYDKTRHTCKTISVADGLSNESVCDLMEDSKQQMWCSTLCGINRIDPENGSIVRYYSGDGLVDKQYNRGTATRNALTGDMYFAGVEGITQFQPLRLTAGQKRTNVMLTGFYINNVPANARTLSGGNKVMDIAVTEADHFRLGYDDNSFTLEFSTLDFSNAEDVSYEYTLDQGTSGVWQKTLPGTNRINFSHLDAGSHTLYVRACQNGSYSAVRRYNIHVSAPWYASTLALIIYLCIFAGALYSAFAYYNRRRRDELNEMKLQFFTNISHEIRSPMTMIISPLDKLLKDTTLDASLRQPLQIMYRNANRILGLVNQLLDIRKIDKGQMKLQCCQTDMVPFLQDIYELFGTQAASHHIAFTYEHPMEELIAWIDRNSIDKVVINLLSNAFKYTPAGGSIGMSLSLGTDSHVDGPLHHYLQVCVTDTGIGLNENETSRIFERFYRSRNSLATSGTGIGLHLCKALVRTHRGTIYAANRTDCRGSIFTFRLPLGKAHLKADEIVDSNSVHRLVLTDEAEVQTVEKTVAPRTPRGKTGSKLLVIDDDEDIMEFLRSELSTDYKVITCSNGKEGLQLALSQNPILIISDVMMPEMDGYTFVKLLKSNANISHIPVILLSAKSELHDRVEGLGRGADAYLAKPFHIDELTTLIHGLIANRQRLIGKFSGQQEQADRVENVEMQSSDEALMERIMRVINANISNSDFNIEDLASEVGLSRTHLHRKLKELTGISASEFIRNIRFRQAALLLREKRMNISQIAYAVGFSNQTHFSTSFKKFYGMSPTEYIDKAESDGKGIPEKE